MFYISVSNIDTNTNKIEGKIQKERREKEKKREMETATSCGEHVSTC